MAPGTPFECVFAPVFRKDETGALNRQLLERRFGG